MVAKVLLYLPGAEPRFWFWTLKFDIVGCKWRRNPDVPAAGRRGYGISDFNATVLTIRTRDETTRRRGSEPGRLCQHQPERLRALAAAVAHHRLAKLEKGESQILTYRICVTLGASKPPPPPPRAAPNNGAPRSDTKKRRCEDVFVLLTVRSNIPDLPPVRGDDTLMMASAGSPAGARRRIIHPRRSFWTCG